MDFRTGFFLVLASQNPIHFRRLLKNGRLFLYPFLTVSKGVENPLFLPPCAVKQRRHEYFPIGRRPKGYRAVFTENHHFQKLKETENNIRNNQKKRLLTL